MNNDQCEAIIKAIATAAEFLFTNGVPIWQPIGDQDNNATAKAAAVTTFETAIETIINDLPDENP